MTFQGFSEFTKRSFTALILILCFGGSYLHSGLLFSFALAFVLLVILVTEWPKLAPVSLPTYILISLLYPITPIVSLIALTLHYRDSNFFLPLYPFLIAWTADTCGYLVGKACGKHKIYPAISPGKSWEASLAHATSRTATLQSRGGGTRQQDGPHGLGAAGPWWHLSGA